MTALSAVAARILGALIEKEKTTPDAYPLSLNALVAACNQTSNRDPVMSLDEQAVSAGVDELRRLSLVRAGSGAGSRVLRYQHLAAEQLGLDAAQLAVLGILLLRGPQTVGEIRTRTNRLYDFADVEQVEGTLDWLAARAPEPLVLRLPRQPGQKEARYAHLLSGDVVPDEVAPAARAEVRLAAPDRLTALEETVQVIRTELADLRAQLAEFRRQFE